MKKEEGPQVFFIICKAKSKGVILGGELSCQFCNQYHFLYPLILSSTIFKKRPKKLLKNVR